LIFPASKSKIVGNVLCYSWLCGVFCIYGYVLTITVDRGFVTSEHFGTVLLKRWLHLKEKKDLAAKNVYNFCKTFWAMWN